MSHRLGTESSQESLQINVSRLASDPGEEVPPTASELFDLYERLVQTRPNTSDAQIFEKIREWTFSDYTVPAYEFAGVTKAELEAWQKRNRINLSAGHIRPAAIDIERGHIWSHRRHTNSINRIHAFDGPPSAHDLKAGKH